MKYKKNKEHGVDMFCSRSVFQFKEVWEVQVCRESLYMRDIPINMKRNLRDDWKSMFANRVSSWGGVDEV